MKAVVMTAPGGVEQLKYGNIDDPEISSETQIKVELEAAGVNPVDTKIRRRGVFFANGFPAILGCDGAGVVVEVGDKVSRFSPGDEVWFCHGGLGGATGNYAQFIVLEESFAQKKPETLTFAEAAALPLVLITAWEALFDQAKLQPAETVLIHAGAGGVGHVAIQLAKIAGAKIITTVSTTEKAELVKSLGADEVILYRDKSVVDAVNHWTHGQGVDVVLEGVNSETFQQSLEILAYQGRLATLLDPGDQIQWKEARNRNISVSFVMMLTPQIQVMPKVLAHQGEILEQCGQWIDQGRLTVAIDKTFPLEQAAQAQTYIETGHAQGKVVLTI